MTNNHSRNFPTVNSKVGNIRLAKKADKSDISAMPPAQAVRQTIQNILDKNDVGAVEVIEKIKKSQNICFGRDYLRDFMVDKKSSLSSEFCQAFAEEFDANLEKLLVSNRRLMRTRPGQRA